MQSRSSIHLPASALLTDPAIGASSLIERLSDALAPAKKPDECGNDVRVVLRGRDRDSSKLVIIAPNDQGVIELELRPEEFDLVQKFAEKNHVPSTPSALQQARAFLRKIEFLADAQSTEAVRTGELVLGGTVLGLVAGMSVLLGEPATAGSLAVKAREMLGIDVGDHLDKTQTLAVWEFAGPILRAAAAVKNFRVAEEITGYLLPAMCSPHPECFEPGPAANLTLGLAAFLENGQTTISGALLDRLTGIEQRIEILSTVLETCIDIGSRTLLNSLVTLTQSQLRSMQALPDAKELISKGDGRLLRALVAGFLGKYETMESHFKRLSPELCAARHAAWIYGFCLGSEFRDQDDPAIDSFGVRIAAYRDHAAETEPRPVICASILGGMLSATAGRHREQLDSIAVSVAEGLQPTEDGWFEVAVVGHLMNALASHRVGTFDDREEALAALHKALDRDAPDGVFLLAWTHAVRSELMVPDAFLRAMLEEESVKALEKARAGGLGVGDENRDVLDVLYTNGRAEAALRIFPTSFTSEADEGRWIVRQASHDPRKKKESVDGCLGPVHKLLGKWAAGTFEDPEVLSGALGTVLEEAIAHDEWPTAQGAFERMHRMFLVVNSDARLALYQSAFDGMLRRPAVTS